MTDTAQFITTRPDGTYDISAPGLLLLSIAQASNPGVHLAGRALAQIVADAFIEAARAGGFAQAGVLEELVAGGEQPERQRQLAIDACAAAGEAALAKIVGAVKALHDRYSHTHAPSRQSPPEGPYAGAQATT